MPELGLCVSPLTSCLLSSRCFLPFTKICDLVGRPPFLLLLYPVLQAQLQKCLWNLPLLSIPPALCVFMPSQGSAGGAVMAPAGTSFAKHKSARLVLKTLKQSLICLSFNILGLTYKVLVTFPALPSDNCAQVPQVPVSDQVLPAVSRVEGPLSPSLSPPSLYNVHLPPFTL